MFKMDSIATDAGVSATFREISIVEIKKNQIAIGEIHVDDLFELEKDLDYHEKVSLMFLLCADDRRKYQTILQQLIVLSFDQTKDTDLLRTWSKCNIDWKNHLLEALCIIQAKCIIRKLGLIYRDLEQRYLPENHHISSYIHLIVKLLYFISEQLTTKQCHQLVEYMKHKYPIVRNFIYSDNGEHLEIYLINWLWENIIDIGQIDNNDGVTSIPCNLEPIIQWLKKSELDSLKDIVKDVTNRFNGGTIRKHSLKMMQTDDRQTNDEIPKSFESMHLQIAESKTVYQIRPKSAGIILIINQKKFHFDQDAVFKPLLPQRRLDSRDGTDRDAEALQRIFRSFGYETRVKNDLSHLEMLYNIRKVVNECVQLDSVIVCILSHGGKGFVYGANSVPVKIEDIEKLIVSERLIGKPKILIIQACQGEETQRAREVDFLANDGPSNSLPVYSDFVTCISSVPGFTSIRHTQDGSWFIQTLCDKLKQLSKQKHFIDILTVVNDEVLNKRGRDNQCMVPIFHSTLRFFLHFPSVN